MNARISTTVLALAVTATLAAQSYQNQPYQNQSYQNQPGQQDANEQDPPSRVARIATLQGNVSLEPAGVDTFSAAELNYPLTIGDRVYADNSSLTELQTSGLALRLGNGADLTVTSLTDNAAQFGLAQGSVRLRTRDLSSPDGSQALVEIDTPNGAIVVLRGGDIRVDSYPQDDSSVVTVTSGQVEITASGQNGEYTETLNQGQSLRLSGANPVYAQAVRPLPPDTLDRYDNDLEQQRNQSLAAAGQYAESGMVGLADLGNYGDWTPDQEYGQVWYPRAVPANWTPYSVGHWAWVAPWGWTWVDAEPWGFAPFHYGRWAQFGGRWGWVPGPPPALLGPGRPIRAVYSPALVAFVGGPRFSISIGFGGGSGAGVTAWFPLGPREVYQPPYHTTPGYVNRVNVTNIYNRNAVEVRNTYVNRTTNIYNTQVNNTYVNRNVATTAVSQRDFAAGRRVSESQPVRFDSQARQQLNQAPILPHPLVTPQASSAAPAAAPRAVPPLQGRPVLETRQALDAPRQDGSRQGSPQQGFPQQGFPQQDGPRNGSRNGFERQGNGTGSAPGAPGQFSPAPAPVGQDRKPVQPVQASPQRVGTPPQPVPADRNPVNPVQQQPQRVGNQSPYQTPGQPQAGQPQRGGFPSLRDHQPVAAAPATPAPAIPATPQGRPDPATPHLVPPQVHTDAPPAPANPRGRPVTMAPVAVQPAAPQAPVPVRQPDQPRPLVNRNPPQQTPQPAFAQQQREIERTDPGRPLNPAQVQNLRNNQPAGPGRPEAVPHPAPAPAPAAAPAAKPTAAGNPTPGRKNDRQPPPPQ